MADALPSPGALHCRRAASCPGRDVSSWEETRQLRAPPVATIGACAGCVAGYFLGSHVPLQSETVDIRATTVSLNVPRATRWSHFPVPPVTTHVPSMVVTGFPAAPVRVVTWPWNV